MRRQPRSVQPPRATGTVAVFAITLGIVFAAVGVPVPQDAAAAETFIFSPVADTYVRADRATQNFGTGTKLRADASPDTRTLMRFDLSALGEAEIQSATLRLRATAITNDGGTVAPVGDDTWQESSVTWNNAPPAGNGGTASIGPVTSKSWQSVDVTSFVSETSIHSLEIRSSSAAEAIYISREGSASLRPQLVVVASPPLDTSDPQATITTPPDGSTATGDLEVDVFASDDTAVDFVELYLDETVVGTRAQTPYTFSVDSMTFTNGPHVLQARARDAAGNVGVSAPVGITVDNPVDLEAPSPPSQLTATAISANQVDLAWTASVDNVAVHHYAVIRDGSEMAAVSNVHYSDRSVLPETSYEYSVVAYDIAGNASEASPFETVTTPEAVDAFTFAAAGDLGENPTTVASFNALDSSSAEFFLALGDMDYDNSNPDSTWCEYVREHMPSKGPEFPFELVAGNHEQQGGPDGYILNHTACLPDRLGAVTGPGSFYGAEYYFDYPAVDPLMRVVMLPPQLTIEGTKYTYETGSPHRSWLIEVIDEARTSGIPWVAVGMHYHCISLGAREGCAATLPLWNLLLAQKVDLILNGHEHYYHRSHQLGLNSSTCKAMKANTYIPGCVVDSSADNQYTKGAGTVNVLAGSFGESVTSVNRLDPEIPYIANFHDDTFGYVEYDVSRQRIAGRFVPTTGTSSDAFSITAP